MKVNVALLLAALFVFAYSTAGLQITQDAKAKNLQQPDISPQTKDAPTNTKTESDTVMCSCIMAHYENMKKVCDVIFISKGVNKTKAGKPKQPLFQNYGQIGNGNKQTNFGTMPFAFRGDWSNTNFGQLGWGRRKREAKHFHKGHHYGGSFGGSWNGFFGGSHSGMGGMGGMGGMVGMRG